MALDHLQPLQEPFGEFWIRQVVEDAPALAPLRHQPVGAQVREVLRRPGVGDAQELRQRGDVALAAADLLDDPEPAGMAENREHLGKFLAGDFSERHLGFLSEECLL